jgi:uncharacterized protein with GYD domain
MAKFLIQGSYTAEGAKGLIKEGGTARKAAVQKALEGLGGKLDSFYYTSMRLAPCGSQRHRSCPSKT